MNYGANTTLLEMDTKNRYGSSNARNRSGHRSMSSGSQTGEYRSSKSSFSTLAKVPMMELLASLVAAVVVGGAVASAAIIA